LLLNINPCQGNVSEAKKTGGSAMQSTSTRHGSVRRTFRRTVLAAGVLIAAGVLAIVGSIWQSRNDALEDAERAAANIASVVAEQVSNSAQAVDLVLEEVKAEARRLSLETPSSFSSVANTKEMFEFLKARLERLPQADAIIIIDSSGKGVSSSRQFPPPPTDSTNREYFAFHKEHGGSTLVISPVNSLVTGRWMAYFSRRLETSNGEFLGVVIIPVRPDTLMQVSQTASSMNGQSFMLLRTDGTILTRFPDQIERTGVKLPTASAWYKAVEQGGGFFRSPGIFDETARLIAVRRVGKYPFVVNVASSEAAALETWRRHSIETSLGATFACLCVAALTFALVAQFNRLRLANGRFDAALNNTSHGIAMYDADGRLAIWNERWCQMYNFTSEQARVGATLPEMKAAMLQNGFFWGGNPKVFSKKTIGYGETTIVELNDGRVVSITRNEMSEGGWVVTHADVTERTTAAARITHLALHDSLTDLSNRVHFHEKLEEAQSRATKNNDMLAVLFMDLDRFKAVNDTLGHPIGDLLLCKFGERLRKCARSNDTIARLGGDEFALILESVDQRCDVARLAERILNEVARPFEIEGHMIQVSTSIGIAMGPSDGASADSLLKHADLALYRAKSDGRAGYCFFEPSMSAEAQRRHSLEMELHRAVQREEFELHYQPVVDLANGHILGFEALVRWRHPTKGLIAPSEFISLAEDTGIIVQLGDWVLRRACADAAQWPPDIGVAVNLSAVQIKSCGIVQSVLAALQATGVNPRRLELEITESVLLNDTEANIAVLRELRAAGIKTSMDDFGTGYSSLGYLRRFPFDKVKIDKSFVQEVCELRGGQAVVRAVIEISESVGMTTIAEGVETEEQLEMLRTLGCTAAQGYLFSVPQPATEIPGMLREFNSARTAS
jgi:diguanylate cyclase (GGDEF)-like protein